MAQEANSEKYVPSQVLQQLMPRGFIMYGPSLERNLEVGRSLIQKAQITGKSSLYIRGETGSGKTTLAAKLAQESKLLFTQVCTPEDLVGLSENEKCLHIKKVFEDAYDSGSSCLILDDIERLFAYCPVGPTFSNSVLQTLLVFLKKRPPPSTNFMIIAISCYNPHEFFRDRFQNAEYSLSHVIEDTGLSKFFDRSIHLGKLSEEEQIKVIKSTKVSNAEEIGIIKTKFPKFTRNERSIARLLEIIDECRQVGFKPEIFSRED